ncbi:MAG TPA: PAS domain-containing protein [Alphaproteobacteria bacterium]|nr:PAS domain-containing protein [Alphaproteobacteria bacterium]
MHLRAWCSRPRVALRCDTAGRGRDEEKEEVRWPGTCARSSSRRHCAPSRRTGAPKGHGSTLPARRDIDPWEMRNFLSHVFLATVTQSPLRFWFRLVGGEVEHRNTARS